MRASDRLLTAGFQLGMLTRLDLYLGSGPPGGLDAVVRAAGGLLAIIEEELKMSTVCKFVVNAVRETQGSRQALSPDGTVKQDAYGRAVYEPCIMRTLTMSPVYGNGDPNHENTKFWQATPSGTFELACVKLDAVKDFDVGDEVLINLQIVKKGNIARG